MNDFSPLDRFVRKHWLDKLWLEFVMKMYRYCHGNSLGSMTLVWRLPTDSPENPTLTAKAITLLNSKQRLFCTRQMRKDFHLKISGQSCKSIWTRLSHLSIERRHGNTLYLPIAISVRDLMRPCFCQQHLTPALST